MELNYVKHCQGIKRFYDLETKIRDHKNEVLNGLKNNKPVKHKKIYNSRWSGSFDFYYLEKERRLIYYLYHYLTPILKIVIDLYDYGNEATPKVLSGIWNSSSDVQGVNKCLKAFNLPFGYSSTKGLQKIKF